LNTVASLIGRVHGDLHFTDKRCEFSLRTAGGMFHIKASGWEQITFCRVMRSGDQVFVLGRPGSYKPKSCRQHHVYFEAVTLLPVEQTEKFERLLTALILEAIKSKSSNE
jgi:hypothetical protein